MPTVKGTLRTFDSGTYRATVQLADSLGTYLDNVPVSRAILSAEMTPGRTVAVTLFGDGHDPEDAQILGVF